MVWQYCVYVGVFLIGNFYASFGLITPMICVNFALPTTRKLADQGWFANASIIRKKYQSTVVIWAVINFLVFIIAFCFVPTKFALAFFIGNLWVLVTGFGKTRANQANVDEYLQAALPYLKVEKEDDALEIAKIVAGK